MTAVMRATPPKPQANLFSGDNLQEWENQEGWATKLKTVESAKDKMEGLKARAKGKRGGDASKGNVHTYSFNEGRGGDMGSQRRREYAFKPEDRNPLMVGEEVPEKHRPFVKRVAPPREKQAPVAHKVVNRDARQSTLTKGASGSSYEVLIGSGTVNKEPSSSKKVTRNPGEQSTPPVERPTGRGGRKEHETTDPWKADLAPPPDLNSLRHRCVPSDVRKMHTFEEAPRANPFASYKVVPPYGVDLQ